MHVLLVAPSAPPKNSPEAMQTRRFLVALDPDVDVTLVTTPTWRGWEREDASLGIVRRGLRVVLVSLPMHRVLYRLLANHRLSKLHVPDADFWFPLFVDHVVDQIHAPPDVIYSRSAPFSSAIFARRLKRRLGKPWMMHLSDPWSGSPYRVFGSRLEAKDRELEAQCFADADCVGLTTDGQAAFYRARYPDRANRIVLTPNMMPTPCVAAHLPPVHRRRSLHLVYAGTLYGAREPSTLLSAIHKLYKNSPAEAEFIKVDFYGNMPLEISSAVTATPRCVYHGPVSFAEATEAQTQADALITIEPGGKHPLLRHFMPSKNLDYMALRKPILAITPAGSETARLCAAGHGWAAAPGDADCLEKILLRLVRERIAGASPMSPPDPSCSPFRAEVVTGLIVQTMRELISTAATGRKSE